MEIPENWVIGLMFLDTSIYPGFNDNITFKVDIYLKNKSDGRVIICNSNTNSLIQGNFGRKANRIG
jgi:hypothetical protein